MRILLFVFPIALLVAYSQIVMKWRMLGTEAAEIQNIHLFARLLKYLSDPVIVSAYAAALLASFVWLYVNAKLTMIVALPIYIGVTFVLVVTWGWLFRSESITAMRLMSVFLILVGIVIGVRN